MPLSKEKKIVIKAVNDLGRRVSSADIATKTGLPVASATQTLNQIAEETGGHLQVSASGDIAYQFPINYQSAYISRGIKHFIEQFNKKLFEVGFFLLRISFGVMLILSLVTIVMLFILIVTATARSRDNDDFNIDLDFFDWMILRDLLYWQMNYATYGTSTGIRKPAKNNFLYNCFSFLFGDGNPNTDIEERRWHAIAELIRQNQGVIICDQIAPYTGADPKNDDNALPVLVRFDGRPTVTDSGNIVYLFPALQATAINAHKEEQPPYLKVLPWRFSQVEEGALMQVFILAAINFIASWCLYIEAVKFLPSLLPLLLILVIYGSLFVAVPLIRYLAIQLLNKNIEDGNKLRKQYADNLKQPNSQLQKKLVEVKQMLLGSRQIKTDNLIYDTEKDIVEQEFLNNA